MDPVREYRRLDRRENGRIVLTITLVTPQVTIKWREKGYSSEINRAVERAYHGARRALAAVRDVEEGSE